MSNLYHSLELNHDDESKIFHTLKYLDTNIPAVHGFSYQAKVLMYFFMKLFAKTSKQLRSNIPMTFENFSIGSEIKEFGPKFDDIVLKHGINIETQTIHLIQVKHVIDENTLLTIDDLKIKKDEKFKLDVYYKSFVELCSSNNTKYSTFAILTNIMFSSEVYKIMDEIKDPFFNINISNNSIYNPERVLEHKQKPYENKRAQIFKLKKNIEFDEIFQKNTKSTPTLIDEFYDKFRLIVGQPNEDQMDTVLKNQFKRVSNQPMSEFIDTYHLKIFLDYFKEKGECDPDLKFEDGKKIIEMIKIRANNFKLVSKYDFQLKNVKYEEDETIIKIKGYYDSSDLSKFLLIKTDWYILTLAKIYQCLMDETYKNNNSELLIIEFHTGFIQNSHREMLENIRYFNFCVIIFHKNIGLAKQTEILSMVIRKINIKVIIIGPIELEDTDKTISLVDNVQFKNLTNETKNGLVQRKIKFDGYEVRLTDLASTEVFENVNSSDWLSKLVLFQQICTKETKIEFNHMCYVERVLKWRNQIGSTLDAKGNNKFCYNEEDFKEFKKANPEGYNIHLIKLVNPDIGILSPDFGSYWIKTDGDIDYIRKHTSDDYSDVSEIDIVKSDRKLNIIVSPEGMGKTTLLKSIYFKTRNSNPSNWIEVISLPKYIAVLKENFKNMEPIPFLLKYVLKYYSITAELFKHHTIGDKKMIFMFDSFDEIWPENKAFTINLINKLNIHPNIKQIWLTSRPADQEYFEKITEIPYNLDYFSYEQQIDYIINCLKMNDIEDLSRIAINSSIKDLEKIHNIELKIPFQAEKTVEYLIKEYGENLNFSKIVIDKFLLYKFCVQKKYDKYKIVKHNAKMDDYSFQMEYEKSIKTYNEQHQELALAHFAESTLSKDFPKEDYIIINNIGMVMIGENERVVFSHGAFAAFFVAQFFLKVLSGEIIDSDNKHLDLLLTEFLYRWEYDEVRNFLNKFLEGVSLSKEMYHMLSDRMSYHMQIHLDKENDYGFRINYCYKNTFNILYKAVRLMSREHIHKYKECIPTISDVLEFCQTDQLFVSKMIEENSEYMQYIIDFEVLEDAMRFNYSNDVLEIILIQLEKNVSTNDQFIDFFNSKNSCNRTLLYTANGNGFVCLLNYLKTKCISNDKLELLLLNEDDDDLLFIHQGKCIQSALIWIKLNMDDNFYSGFIHLIYPSLIDQIEDENEFIFYTNEIISSISFDELTTPGDHLLLHAIAKQFSVESLFFTISVDNAEDIICNVLQYGSIDSVTKIIKFCKKHFLKELLKINFFNLNIIELDMLVSRTNEKYSENLKEYVEKIGTFGIILRLTYQRMLEEYKETEYLGEEELNINRYKTELEDEILSELELIPTYNEDILNDVLTELHVSKQLQNVANKIKIKKSECYFDTIFETFLDADIHEYFWQSSVLVNLCYETFENKFVNNAVGA